jgi:hypothetical protein
MAAHLKVPVEKFRFTGAASDDAVDEEVLRTGANAVAVMIEIFKLYRVDQGQAMAHLPRLMRLIVALGPAERNRLRGLILISMGDLSASAVDTMLDQAAAALKAKASADDEDALAEFVIVDHRLVQQRYRRDRKTGQPSVMRRAT